MNPTADGVNLEREIPVGCKVSVVVKQIDSTVVNFVALQVRSVFKTSFLLLSEAKFLVLPQSVNRQSVNRQFVKRQSVKY
jgi:hypothetical protein